MDYDDDNDAVDYDICLSMCLLGCVLLQTYIKFIHIIKIIIEFISISVVTLFAVPVVFVANVGASATNIVEMLRTLLSLMMMWVVFYF